MFGVFSFAMGGCIRTRHRSADSQAMRGKHFLVRPDRVRHSRALTATPERPTHFFANNRLTFGDEIHPIPVGMMIDHSACTLAGVGMAQLLEAANPGLTVLAECRDMEERA